MPTPTERKLLAHLIAEPGLYGSRLAIRAGVPVGSVYTLLGRLQMAGLVTSSEDGRRRLYWPTVAGESASVPKQGPAPRCPGCQEFRWLWTRHFLQCTACGFVAEKR